jgi:hypothetical protein
MEKLEKEKGNITSETIRNILRGHEEKISKNNKELYCNSVGSICMHAGGMIGDHTTNSYIGVLNKDHQMYYTTAASTPCLMPYRPLVIDDDMPISSDEEKALKLWLNNERFVRYIRAGQIDKQKFIEERDAIEKNIFSEEYIDFKKSDKIEKIKKTWIDIDNLINKYLITLKGIDFDFKSGSHKFRKYWKKRTSILFKN